MSLAHSSVVNMIPNQSTVKKKTTNQASFHKNSINSVSVNQLESHLNVLAVVTSCRQLYSSEGDRTFERNLDGRLFYAVLSVERGAARRCRYATEVPLN